MDAASPKVKADDSTILAWQESGAALKDNNAEAALKKLNDAATSLTAQDTKVTKLITDLEKLTKTPEIDNAVTKLKATQKKVKDKNTEAGKAKDDLKTSADKVFKSADAVMKDLKAQVKKLSDLVTAPVIQTPQLQKTLSEQLEILPANIILHGKLDAAWKPLDTELKRFSDSPPVNPAGAFTASKTTIDEILNSLAGWLEKLGADAESTNSSLFEMREKLDKDLQNNSVAGLKLLKDSEEKKEKLTKIAEKTNEIIQQTKENAAYSQPAVSAIQTNLDEVNKHLEGMPQSIGLVREGLAGDYTNFVADFVPLYYFTDVFNLMKILNPEAREIRDVSALREEAQAARRKVDRADLDLSNYQAEVNGLQTRVRDLEQELAMAENNFNVSTRLLTQATRAVAELESRPNPDAGRIRLATQRRDDLNAQNTADKETLDKLRDEKTGLPVKIKEAREKLLAAQKQVREARTEMISLAKIESDAFAEARDNESVFYAPNVVTSKDPIKQVIIYAFSSRKVIYLRGKEENVNEAKNIIALFDRPAPQARLNLWTLELNSTATRKGAENFNKSLEKIESQLSDTRLQIAAALSYLRDCINEEVNSIALTKLQELETARLNNPAGVFPVKGQQTVAPQNAEDLRWARLFFYQKEVLFRLGFDPEQASPIDSRNQLGNINRIALPDPAGNTTLGESLIILTLANPSSRYEIMKKFSEGVEDKLNTLGLCNPCRKTCGKVTDNQPWFAAIKRALGADPDKPYRPYKQVDKEQLREGRTPPATDTYSPAIYGYTSMQREIVNAITMALVPRLIKRLGQLQQIHSAIPDGDAGRGNVERQITAILTFLWDVEGISPEQIFGVNDRADLKGVAQNDEGLIAVQSKLADFGKKTNILRTANAKVARTDIMLKQMIDAFDEDVDRHFVQPMMRCLREQLIKEDGISVGIMNRTSVLATNRLVARVDPRSSAQLSIGQEQDALLAAQQLADLFLAAKTGGLLGGLGGLSGVQQRDVSEVYGLTSGSVFKVTPIFDPTGQSLRFQFDYVMANLVTNPDGSITPQLPRIERHTVNTEVQLNNLELREISRFMSNARLGIPTTYKGGLPILRDIPYVKYVPLLGWFVRKSGKAAVIQQSLMFGQTTMYPTIADIFDLLSGEDYDFARLKEDCCKVSSGSPTPSPTPSPASETQPTDSSRSEEQPPVSPAQKPTATPKATQTPVQRRSPTPTPGIKNDDVQPKYAPTPRKTPTPTPNK